MYKNLIVNTENQITTITINRPDAMNALNQEVINELYSEIHNFGDNKESRVAILTGAGKAFVAGADIAAMSKLDKKGGRKIAEYGHRLMNQIEVIGKPVIAAVNGFALGGGCELAMACDFRIASEKAIFGQPEVNLGIIPGFGGTNRLAKLVGIGMAKYLIMTADIIGADEAKRIGLVEAVVPAEELMVTVQNIAEKLITKGPLALGMAKSAIEESYEELTVNAGGIEIDYFASAFATEDQKEGMAAFLEKRPAEFKNK
ncbi:MAG: enoyl-CoA hydratase-related protein [Anaerovoracaceae bacterium]